jgi:hypothetical protein
MMRGRNPRRTTKHSSSGRPGRPLSSARGRNLLSTARISRVSTASPSPLSPARGRNRLSAARIARMRFPLSPFPSLVGGGSKITPTTWCRRRLNRWGPTDILSQSTDGPRLDTKTPRLPILRTSSPGTLITGPRQQNPACQATQSSLDHLDSQRIPRMCR